MQAKPCPTNPLRVLLCDDHDLVRQGVSALLGSQPGLDVIGEARGGSEAVALVEAQEPDVVVADTACLSLEGLEPLAQMVAGACAPTVIGLSTIKDRQHIERVLDLGISGYVLKSAGFEHLMGAIRYATAGGVYLCPIVTHLVTRGLAAGERSREWLTGREVDVLQRIAGGSSTRDIARDMQVSAKTVESHRRNIMDKIGASSIADVVKFAIRQGLTRIE